jgi:ligand-binding sensor domain-containing protein/two-component sensor histidine kinase
MVYTRIFTYIFFIFLILRGQLAFGLEPLKAIAQYHNKLSEPKSEFSQGALADITQTKDGYVWFVTGAQLIRYDGLNMKIFDRKQFDESLDSSSFGPLCPSSDGGLWIGSDKKILKYKNDRFDEFVINETSFGSDRLQSIHEDKSGVVWIGTPGSGLRKLEAGKVSRITTDDGLVNNYVFSIAEDDLGAIWVGTRRGVSRIFQGNIKSYTPKDNLYDTWVRSVIKGADGSMWFGTNDGINKYVNETFHRVSDDELIHVPNCLLMDRDGNLWVGNNKGLFALKKGSSKLIQIGKTRHSDNKVTALYEDLEGNIWIGVTRGKVVKLSNTKFVSLTTAHGLYDDYVNAVIEYAKDELWIGTDAGLSLLKSYDVMGVFLSDKRVKAFYKDTDNSIILGLSTGGLYTISKGSIKELKAQRKWYVNSICRDCDGQLLIGSIQQGLAISKDNKTFSYKQLAGQSTEEVRVIHRDRSCNVWIGTNNGLFLYKRGGELIRFTSKDGLSSDSIRSIIEDKGGGIWVGTHQNGLNYLKDQRITQLTINQGLKENTVYQIQQDDDGNLWLGGKVGIYRILRDVLNKYLNGFSKSIIVTSYGIADGIESPHCRINSSASKTHDGKLLFPTGKGLAIIDPTTITLNSIPPPIFIEDFLVDHNRVNHNQSPVLPPGKNDIEIKFTGLSYIAPSEVKFKYILEGYDKDWTDSETRRSAYYTNLPPGKYQFKVVGCNNDGIWNDKGAAFSFYLEPHFYQTNLFYLLCVALIILFVLTLYWLRAKQIRLQFAAVLEERNRIAREVHDTLGQGFVGILSILDGILKASPEITDGTRKDLNRAVRMAKQSILDVRRSLTDLRSSNASDEETDLSKLLTRTLEQFTIDTSVQIHLDVSGDKEPLPHFVVVQLNRISQEAVSNSIKHAQAHNVYIELLYQPDKINLRIADDGCGFDVEEKQSFKVGHYGLLGIKERVQKINGTLNILSWQGEGTEITVQVPINGKMSRLDNGN